MGWVKKRQNSHNNATRSLRASDFDEAAAVRQETDREPVKTGINEASSDDHHITE